MEEIIHYRQIVQNLLREKAERSNARQPNPGESIKAQAVFDIEGDHYLLVYVGWRGNEAVRQYGCVLHIDLIDGKLWIQQDGTEEGFGTVLAERGVPCNDIVLGYLPRIMREAGEYGVGA